MTSNIQFGSVYKVQVKNLPSTKSVNDVTDDVMQKLADDAQQLCTISLDDGSKKPVIKDQNTFYVVTDDETGKDYTAYTEAFNEIKSNVVLDAKERYPSPFLFVYMASEVYQHTVAAISKLKIGLLNKKFRENPDLKTVVFDASADNKEKPLSAMNLD